MAASAGVVRQCPAAGALAMIDCRSGAGSLCPVGIATWFRYAPRRCSVPSMGWPWNPCLERRQAALTFALDGILGALGATAEWRETARVFQTSWEIGVSLSGMVCAVGLGGTPVGGVEFDGRR